jgi:hypothetical protein
VVAPAFGRLHDLGQFDCSFAPALSRGTPSAVALQLTVIAGFRGAPIPVDKRQLLVRQLARTAAHVVAELLHEPELIDRLDFSDPMGPSHSIYCARYAS